MWFSFVQLQVELLRSCRSLGSVESLSFEAIASDMIDTLPSLTSLTGCAGGQAGTVAVDTKCAHLECLCLLITKGQTSWPFLQDIATCKLLRELEVIIPSLRAEYLDALAGLPLLQSFTLHAAPFTALHCARLADALANNEHFRELQVIGETMRGDSLHELASALTAVETLRLGLCSLHAADLLRILSDPNVFPRLKTLSMSHFGAAVEERELTHRRPMLSLQTSLILSAW